MAQIQMSVLSYYMYAGFAAEDCGVLQNKHINNLKMCREEHIHQFDRWQHTCAQVLSITETQYSGANVIVIAPDSDNLSVLQVLSILLQLHII